MRRLEGKVAIVAGAGPGIGRSTALLFAQEGAQVAVISRQKPIGEETAEAIRARGGTALALAADLAQPEQAEGCFRQTLERFGKLDVLHCNAGIYAAAPAEEISEEGWGQMMDANLKTSFLSARSAIPHLVKNGSGSIIFTSAIFGPLMVSKNMAHYNASKAGVVALSQSLAAELASHNIRVNCICPGQISHEPFTKDQASLQTERHVMRAGLPEDIAFAALYLASDEAAWVTGSVLAVDGGMSVGVRLIAKNPQAEKKN